MVRATRREEPRREEATRSTVAEELELQATIVCDATQIGATLKPSFDNIKGVNG
jgi:hypothetical protein